MFMDIEKKIVKYHLYYKDLENPFRKYFTNLTDI